MTESQSGSCVEPRTNHVWRWVLTLLIGFGVGVAFYAAVGPRSIEIPENVQVAVIAFLGATFTVSGVILGNTISGEATRSAARTAQREAELARLDATAARRDARDEAERVRREDRDEERLARFADHILELSSTVMLGMRAVAEGVGYRAAAQQAEAAARGSGGTAPEAPRPSPTYTPDSAFYESGMRLRLLVREPRTYRALDRATEIALATEERIAGEGWRDAADVVAGMEHFAEVYDELEDAIRAELGVPPLPDGSRTVANFADAMRDPSAEATT
jgi:hypothetical protein